MVLGQNQDVASPLLIFVQSPEPDLYQHSGPPERSGQDLEAPGSQETGQEDTGNGQTGNVQTGSGQTGRGEAGSEEEAEPSQPRRTEVEARNWTRKELRSKLDPIF